MRRTPRAGPLVAHRRSASAATISPRGSTATSRPNSGTPTDFIASPKFSLIFGPFDKTEFFLNAGYGFHSNDVRGATITVDPSTAHAAADRCRCWCAPRAPRSACAPRRSTGSRARVALFVLDYDSELLFVGDAGTTEPSRPSRRVGVEWTNHYKVNSWLGFDVDVAYDPRPLHRFRSGRRPHPRRARRDRLGRRGARAARPAGSARRSCATSGRAR